MPRTYRPYEYDYDTPYVGRTDVIENFLEKKLSTITIDKKEISEAVKDSLGDIDCKFCSVHNHIERAKDEIIDNCGTGCMCNIATKEDINNAVSKINSHVDEKFDEVDFLKQFSDLNEQVANLINK